MNDRPFPDIPGAAMDLLLEYLEASKDIPGVFRLIEFWFQVKGIAPALSSALDAGCGWGGIKTFFLSLLCPRIRITGTDADAAAVENCDRVRGEKGFGRVSFYRSDVSRQRPGGAYDLIILSDVLEHVQEDAALVRNLAGCLNEGGFIYVSVPSIQHAYGYDGLDEEGKKDLWEWTRKMGHVRIGYEPEDLRKAFDGFEPITLKKTGTCLSETAHFFWEKVYLRWNVPEEKIVFARPWLGMIHRAAEKYGGTRVTVDPQPPIIRERIFRNIICALYAAVDLEEAGYFARSPLGKTHVVGLFRKRPGG